MINLFKSFKDWNKNRIENNYERIINEHSSEEQELIRKGRNVQLTGKSLNQLIEESPDKEIIPITSGHGNVYHPGHCFVQYEQSTLGLRAYRTNIECWLELGEKKADALCNLIVRPINLSDGGSMTAVTLGIPLKIADKISKQNLGGKIK